MLNYQLLISYNPVIYKYRKNCLKNHTKQAITLPQNVNQITCSFS